VPHSPSDVRCGVSRRAAIGLVAGAALATGCTPTGVDRRSKPRPSTPPVPDEDPDVALAARVLTGEQAILDRLVATVGRHPGLRARLVAAEAAHRAHVRLLTEAVPDHARSGGSASAAPSTPTTPPPPVVPRRPGPALAALAREEGRLSVLDKRSAFAAESGAFARVLASMAASAAQHAVALTSAAAQENR
jgi:hypothetical protein